MIPDLELAWAAGLFEGEGTIRINKPTAGNPGGWLAVSVVNTDPAVVAFFQERWPAYHKRATGQTPRCKQAWVWMIAARKARAFLGDIEPYLRLPRNHARVALAHEFQAQKRAGRPHDHGEYLARQVTYYERMRALNVRGAVGQLPLKHGL